MLAKACRMQRWSSHKLLVGYSMYLGRSLNSWFNFLHSLPLSTLCSVPDDSPQTIKGAIFNLCPEDISIVLSFLQLFWRSWSLGESMKVVCSCYLCYPTSMSNLKIH
jgi:hypothetical protein